MKEYPDFDGTQACANMDTELFYYNEEEGSRTESAKNRFKQLAVLCEGCSFKEACLRYAIKYELHGYWAGTTPEQRINMRKKLGIHVTNPATLLQAKY
jgi:hypothetical protein